MWIICFKMPSLGTSAAYFKTSACLFVSVSYQQLHCSGAGLVRAYLVLLLSPDLHVLQNGRLHLKLSITDECLEGLQLSH